jgi:hypothetical protein
MIAWIGDRFASGPTPDRYVPTGIPGIEATTCPT